MLFGKKIRRNCVTFLADGKACTAYCMVVIFVQLCWRVNSALLLLPFFFSFFLSKLLFLKYYLLQTFLFDSVNIYCTDFSNIYCEPICSVLLVVTILLWNLLTVAWWKDICLSAFVQRIALLSCTSDIPCTRSAL